MVVYTLLIVSKSGGLIYHKEFHPGLNTLSTNDYLVLAGTFHGVHAITRSLTPSAVTASNPSTRGSPLTGLEVLESGLFRLTCFQTISGTKFLLFTEPQQPNVDVVVRKVYELWADYVMKNPFYQLEMPVRCEAFDRHLLAYVRSR